MRLESEKYDYSASKRAEIWPLHMIFRLHQQTCMSWFLPRVLVSWRCNFSLWTNTGCLFCNFLSVFSNDLPRFSPNFIVSVRKFTLFVRVNYPNRQGNLHKSFRANYPSKQGKIKSFHPGLIQRNPILVYRKYFFNYMNKSWKKYRKHRLWIN